MNTIKIILEKNFASILIIVLGILIYSNTFNADWQYDDFGYILQRQSIRDITNVKGIYKALGQPVRFVAFYSFALNYFLHKYALWGYHLFNILIHITNAFLVMGVVKLWIGLISKDTKENIKQVPLFTALLFLTHPINTQAVTYISQRFTSLATLFYLAGVYFYLKSKTHNSLKVNSIYLLLFVVSAIGGMFTKQIVMTLPLMVVMFEIVLRFLKGGRKSLIKLLNWKFTTPILILFLIIPSFYSFNLEKITNVNVSSGSFEGEIITGYNYFLTQARVICTYLRLLIFPVNQNFYYAYSLSQSLLDPKTLLAFVFLIGLFVSGIALIRQRYVLMGVGILWFFIALLVESSVIPIRHVIFEHRMYLSSIGFSLFIVSLITTVFKNIRFRNGLLYFIVVALSLLTFQRNFVWKNGITLWSDVITKTKTLAVPYNNLGFSLSREGLNAQAVGAVTKAIEIRDDFVEAYVNRGIALHNIKQFKAAVSDFSKAIELKPNNAKAYSSRSLTYQAMGEFELEIEDFKKSISLQPEFAPAYFHEGNRFRRRGDYIAALVNYQKALIANPKYLDAYINRGGIFLVQKEYKKALEEFEKALEIDDKNYKVYNNKGLVYLQLKDYVSALESFHMAIYYKNDYIDAYNNRANAYRLTSNFNSAFIDINKALKINNRHAGLYYSRSLIYRDTGQLKQALNDARRAKSLGFNVNPAYFDKLNYFINNPQ